MPRKRTKYRRSRLDNLSKACQNNIKNKETIRAKSKSDATTCERVIKRRKIVRGKPKTRVQPKRKCGVPEAYVVDITTRGTDGGYKKSLRLVRGIVSSRTQWRYYNEEKKKIARKKTLRRQNEQLKIAKLAYTKLCEISC